jgi:methylase of polypeptide subunit release factors
LRKEEYCETSEEAIKDIGKYLCKNNLATSRLFDIGSGRGNVSLGLMKVCPELTII